MLIFERNTRKMLKFVLSTVSLTKYFSNDHFQSRDTMSTNVLYVLNNACNIRYQDAREIL